MLPVSLITLLTAALMPVVFLAQAASFDVQPLADGVYAIIRNDPSRTTNCSRP